MKRALNSLFIAHLTLVSSILHAAPSTEQSTQLIFHDQVHDVIKTNIVQDNNSEQIAEALEHITQKYRSSTPITVRQGRSIAPQETQALAKRLPKIRHHIEKILGASINYKHLPNIALIGSGGGYRSMIASLGFLRGAQKIGLLDSAWYMSTLSGSTWMHAGWLRTQLSVKDFKSFLQKKVETNLFTTPMSFVNVTEMLGRKVYNKQKISLVDIWGAMLGNMLFSEISPTGKDVFLSDLVPFTENGDFPLPIFSSVSPHGDDYTWFEHTPWEVGTYENKAFIPTKAFNSAFDAGTATTLDPEQTLGYHLGVCGSAFAMNAQELFKIYQADIQDDILLRGLEDVVNDLDLGGIRLTRAEVRNFMEYMQPFDQFPQNDWLTLIDAGIDINLALAPMLHRSVDVLVICDAVSDVPLLQAYQQAIEYAAQRGFTLPPSNIDTIDSTSIAVFSDDTNPQTPIVIYIPNEKDYSLFKFEYSEDEFNDLYGSMGLKVVNHEKTIWAAIIKKIEQLKQLFPDRDACVPLRSEKLAQRAHDGI